MTELVFILDRSGSMSGLETDTIGGFNSMIAQQKKEAGEAVVSTVLFANAFNFYFFQYIFFLLDSSFYYRK